MIIFSQNTLRTINGSGVQTGFHTRKFCFKCTKPLHFPTTSVLYLTNLAVFIFLHNHSYKRCSNQYTSTKYTQLQSCDKGKHLISSWVLLLKRIVSILLCGKNQLTRKYLFFTVNSVKKPRHCISRELALQTPYVSYYCQCASRKCQSKTIQPYIIPTPSFHWTSSIQRREAEHTRRWGTALGCRAIGCKSWCNITFAGHGLLIPRHLRD